MGAARVTDIAGNSDPYFHYLRQRGTACTRSVVEDYWVIQAERCRAAVELVLPDACVELNFNLGTTGRILFERPGISAQGSGSRAGLPTPDRCHQAPAARRSWVVGPHAAPLLVAKETKDCDIVGVRLHAGVAAQLLGVSAHELEGTIIDLDLMWGSMVDEIRERLQEAADSTARLRVIDEAIARQLSRAAGATEASRARKLVGRVEEVSDVSIGGVARACGLTHRQVIQLFDRHVGLKPKAYHRVHRLRRVIREIHSSRPMSWARLAAHCGYCDQAHLINDFRKLTGLTPTEYATNRMSVGQGSVPYLLAAS
jgi:AraC-like DNA-binding protein